MSVLRIVRNHDLYDAVLILPAKGLKRFVLLVNIEFPCDIGEASGESRRVGSMLSGFKPPKFETGCPYALKGLIHR